MNDTLMNNLVSRFRLDHAELKNWELYGSGHINETYRVILTENGVEKTYIFQKINTRIFRRPDQLMDNMARVLEQSGKSLAGHPDANRRSIHLVSARDGKWYVSDDSGTWRAYHFISGARTYDILETPEQAYQAAKAFGAFQHQIAGMPGKRLFETIPDFHNTPARYAAFEKALAADVCRRADSCREEIAFARHFSVNAPKLVDLQVKGELPERITHNDTKLNNVLLDESTGEGLCVIDLDTVMPGLALYDFGDMVRTSVSPSAEDETDLSKVQVRTEVFRALVQGYLEGAQGCLTQREIELLPFSGMLITYETGLRFLTDHLEGDVYFRTHRENHNLERCRTQFVLVQRLQEKEAELNAVVKDFLK